MEDNFYKKVLWTLVGAALSTSLCAGTMGPEHVPHNWTGFYIGANAGALWGSFSGPVWVEPLTVGIISTGPSVQYYNEHPSAFTGGGQIGYNVQMNANWLAGAEFHFNGERLNGFHRLTTGEIIDPANNVFVAEDSYAAVNTWHTSILARLGYTWNNWMMYATGGVSLANLAFAGNFIQVADLANINVVYPQSNGTDNEVLVGGTVGLGLAYALSPNLNVGVEGRYTDYGKQRFNPANVPVLNVAGILNSFYYQPEYTRLSVSTTEVMLKLNYQFA